MIRLIEPDMSGVEADDPPQIAMVSGCMADDPPPDRSVPLKYGD
jgi:hypothetical protein